MLFSCLSPDIPTSSSGTKTGKADKNKERATQRESFRKHRNFRGCGGYRNFQNRVYPIAFEGALDKLKGHIFQLHSKSHVSDQFDRTLEAMDSYVGTNYKFCIDI